MSVAIDVSEDTREAQMLLHDVRLELVENLATPASAAVLARRLGAPRQRINYHLRELEGEKLIELVEERRKGSVTERIYRRTGRSYAISPAGPGALGPETAALRDR